MARRFPEFFQDENITFQKIFYSDVTKDTPVDPTSVVLSLKTPSGSIVSPTVANDPGTGAFSAAHVVDEYGDWQWRWQTENPRIVDQGTIFVKEKNVP